MYIFYVLDIINEIKIYPMIMKIVSGMRKKR